MKNWSTKNKTLLFVTIVLILFATVLLGSIYWEQKQVLKKNQESYGNALQTTYDKIIAKRNRINYTDALININSRNIKKSIINQDRASLYDLTIERWKVLQQGNKHLRIMHFYLPDGTSLLRMQAPKKYGDNVTAFRSMIANVTKNHKQIHGFETGNYNLAYRSVIPIFEHNRYIGIVELGSRPDIIFDEMEYYSGLKGALFVKNDPLNLYKNETCKIGNYTLQYDSIKNHPLLCQLAKMKYSFPTLFQLNFNDHSYAIYAFNIYDYNGKVVAKALFVNDITVLENQFIQKLIENTMYLFLLLLLIILIIKLGFQTLIQKLEDTKNILERYRVIVDEYVITSQTDIFGIITYASEAFCRISGYSKKELIGQNHRIIRHPDMSEEVFSNLWRTISSGRVWNGELKNKNTDGEAYWVDTTISPKFENGEVVGYIAIRHDITDKKRLEQIAITDALTGIYNRRHFNSVFSRFVGSAKRNNELICFAIMDVDHFKNYNDTYGHQNGDNVLIQVAQTIQSKIFRSDDYCFRLGGEEFGIIFKDENIEKSFLFVDSIRQSIEKLEIEHRKNSASPFVTVSIGLMCIESRLIENETMLYAAADRCLYDAKENGRNCVVVKERLKT